jgi:hypothetical protein
MLIIIISIGYGYDSLFVGFGILLVNLLKNHWRHGMPIRQTHGGKPADRPHLAGAIVVATAWKVILGQAYFRGFPVVPDGIAPEAI